MGTLAGANSGGGSSILGTIGGIGTAAAGVGQLLGALFGSSQNTSGSTSGSGSSSTLSTEDLQNILNTIQQITSSQNGTSNQQTNGTQTTTTGLSPNGQALLDQMTSTYANLAKPFDTTGYVAGQTQNINAAAQAHEASLNNQMAARGLATSPVAATAQNNIESQRLGQITGVQQQAPLLANQMQLQNLAGATSLLAQMPKTSTTTNNGQVIGTTSQTGTQTGTTNQTGSTTGTTSQQGTTNTNQTTNNTTKTPGLLSTIFSDERLKDDITELPHAAALRKLMQLKPSSWKWKADGSHDSGVVAQDVEKVFPKAVKMDAKSGMKMVDMNALMPHMIAAIQALGKHEKTEAE